MTALHTAALPGPRWPTLQPPLARGERLSYGEASPDPVLPLTSRLTRAEVHAEVLAALARGERLSYGEAGPDLLSRRSTATAAALAAVHGAAVAR